MMLMLEISGGTAPYLLNLFDSGGNLVSTRNTLAIASFTCSLCIHAFMEGMPLTQQPELLIGIIVHKIPIGMVITLLLLLPL